MPRQNAFDRYAWIYNPLMGLSGMPRRNYDAIKRAAKPKKTDSVLDVGGGTGLVAKYFLQDAGRIVVLDPSKKMLAKIKSKKIEKVAGAAQEISFPENTFDIVYCVDAFHHFTNGYAEKYWQKTAALCARELLRVLKKDGILVIIEFDTGKALGKALAFFENRLMRWGSWFYSRNEFASLFTAYGAEVSVLELDRCCFVAKIRKHKISL